MKPTIVDVHWSEAGGALAEDAVMTFAEFEAAAYKAAMGHTSGGYLKTKITVHFNDGSTYGCRIDLGASYRLEKGFADGIAQRIKFHESAEGRARRADWPADMRAEDERMYALWKQMDFTPAEPAPRRVALPAQWGAACSLPIYESTKAGEQAVIPGTREYQRRPAKRGEQMDLFL